VERSINTLGPHSLYTSKLEAETVF